MQLINQSGRRLTRPRMTDLERLLMEIRRTPYSELNEVTRLRLKLALDLQQQEREQIRFAPIH